MYRTVTVSKRGWLSALLVLSVVSAAPLQGAAPKIQIQVIKTGGADCKTQDPNCKIYVKERGVGVCKEEQEDTVNPGEGVYCHTELTWDLIGHGKLESEHVVLILWSTQSSPGSQYCLDALSYTVTKDKKLAPAEVMQDPKCPSKATWLYDVVLLYKGQEVARDDPGVLIEN